jgi:transposase
MPRQLVDDALWSAIEPLIPPPKRRRKRYPGRKPLENRQMLTGILFVLLSGIPWEMLPQEMGCGSGMTCWRRLRAWQKAGVWDRLREVLLVKLREAGKIDFARVIADPSATRAVNRGAGRDRPIAVKPTVNNGSSRMRKTSRSTPL